ncbi:MAG TPA: hypothetical protein PLX54_01375 [Candidatus Fermentibacter daniensis]|nr:hypothetical protein [Candidatus Fermentibacter daniensis]HPK51008.1 hypothetical protein [Candidatus Fermentibacter daniensis]
MMRRALLLIASALVLFGAGCTKTAPITVTNSLGDYDIAQIYIYPADQANRGEDLQAADLTPGQSAVFQFVPGNYNILIIDEDDDSYFFENLTVPKEGLTKAITDDLNWDHQHVGSGHYPLTITNDLVDYDIWYLYIDPAGTGPANECMGSNIVYTGDKITVWVEPGSYDIQVVDDTDFTYTYEAFAVSETAATLTVMPEDIDTPRPPAIPTTVTIVNGLDSYDIWYVYVFRTIDPWGDDRLGASTLAPGESIDVDITTGAWDMKVQDEDGNTYTLWGQEIGPEGFVWNVTLDQID